MKEQNKQTVILNEAVLFDSQLIDRISFDLIHINQGWDDEKHDYNLQKRSSYTAADIVDLFEQFKYISTEWTFGNNKKKIKIRGVSHSRYHCYTTDVQGCPVRIILDLPEVLTSEGIIVTVYKP